MGVEVLAAAVVAYLLRKAARVGRRADRELDQALDVGMDRLHEVVTARLGADTALTRLQEQAADGGEPTERTLRRAEDAIADAAEEDQGFAAQLEALVKALAARETAGGVNPPAAVTTLITITGGTQNGPMITGSVGHLTVHSPAPPPQPTPEQVRAAERRAEQDRHRQAERAAYHRFLGSLPQPNFQEVGWVKPKGLRSLGAQNKLEEISYSSEEVKRMLEEIQKLISEASGWPSSGMSKLSAYLMSLQPHEMSGFAPGWLTYYSKVSVDRYLDGLRQCVRVYFTEAGKT